MLKHDEVIVLQAVSRGRTREEMAEDLGKSTSMAQKVFSRLVKDGYIDHVPKRNKNKLTAKAVQELEANHLSIPQKEPVVELISHVDVPDPEEKIAKIKAKAPTVKQPKALATTSKDVFLP